MIGAALYFSFAIFQYVLFYRLSRDVLNPFGISLLTLLGGMGLACLNLGEYTRELTMGTHLVVILASMAIACAGLFSSGKRHIEKKSLPIVGEDFVRVYYLTVALVFSCALFYFLQSDCELNALRQIDSSTFDLKGSIEPVEVPSVVRFMIHFMPFLPLLSIYDLLFREKEGKVWRAVDVGIIVLACAFIWFVQVSRGSLLATALGSLYLVNYKLEFKLKQIVPIFFLGVVVFSAASLLRVNRQSGIYSGISDSPVINVTYNYIAPNYINLDSLVKRGSPQTKGMVTFPWVFEALDIFDETQKLDYEIGPLNAKTALYNYYHDFGYLGVIIGPLITYGIVGYLEKMSRSMRPELILITASMQKAVFTSFYANYFFGPFGNTFPYLLMAAIVLFAYKTTSNGTRD